ncbi:MAG: glycosyltransferase family 25 protein [Chlamydiia bacterium]
MTNLKPIDCIYVINLECRPDKWERMNNLFLEEDKHATRFIGVDGFDLSIDDQLLLTNGNPLNLSPGQIGCFLSHLSVYQHAFEHEFNYIWICEDDLVLVSDLERIPELINELNLRDPDWDVLYTDRESIGFDGRPFPERTLYLDPDRMDDTLYFLKKFKRKTISKNIQKLGLRFGAYSYIVSKKGIQKYINHFANRRIYSPLDAEMHYIKGLNEYCVKKDIAIHWFNTPYSDTNRREKAEGKNRNLP